MVRRMLGYVEEVRHASVAQLALLAGAGLVVLVIDLLISPYIETSVFYVALVALAIQSGRPRAAGLVAAVGSSFAVVELALSAALRGATAIDAAAVLNRALAIGVVWITALVGSQLVRSRAVHQRMREARVLANQLRHSRDGLEERVRERTRALSQLNDALRHEITRRHLAEDRLRQSEAHHRALSMSLQEAVRRTDSFLATLSHELRNPLAPLRNSAQALQRLEPGDPAIRDFAVVIERQAGQLARLLEDLLDISRCQTDTITLRRGTVEVGEMVGTLTDDYSRLFRERGLNMSVKLHDTPVLVSGDRARLVQALTNVLVNSAYFTSAGGRIAVQVEPREPSDVEITVSDSGMGMNAETLSHVFEPFRGMKRRADGAPGGLGLGLSVAQRLLRLHGGEISARSEGPGHGSEFTLRLPRLPDTIRAPHEAPALPSPESSELRIVVIDDHRDTADSTRALLELAGHRVTVAYRAQEGLDAAKRTKPDVVFCDVELSDTMDGYGVARALRANPELEGVYLVAITGYGRARDKERARDAGFDLHLTKPVDLLLLERTLASRQVTR